MRRLVLVLRILASLALLGTAAALAFVVWLTRDLPSLEPLEHYRPAVPSIVVDREGRPIAEFYAERRRMTPLGDVPPVVLNAFLASEDADFFQHHGVDVAALLRASLANLRAGGKVRQGGSTITQQLAKNLLLTPERTVARKLRDIALALRIERALPKEQIVEIYLNDVYLGRGAYGVAQAARAYFGKELDAVTASEAALLDACTDAARQYFGDFEARTEMKDNGPRVDGTRTVGGEIYLETRSAYVACAFPRDRLRLIEFVVDGKDQLASLQKGRERSPSGTPNYDRPVGGVLPDGSSFSASAQIACQRTGTGKAQCDAGVVREGSGKGFVMVFWPDRGTRVLYFEKGRISRYDESEADGGAKLTVTRRSDVQIVSIGDARFEVFDALLTGG